MKQIELAKVLGVSEAYISMVVKGKKQPSRQVIEKLRILGIHFEGTVLEAKPILSHARLPIPTLPRKQISTRSILLLMSDTVPEAANCTNITSV